MQAYILPGTDESITETNERVPAHLIACQLSRNTWMRLREEVYWKFYFKTELSGCEGLSTSRVRKISISKIRGLKRCPSNLLLMLEIREVKSTVERFY